MSKLSKWLKSAERAVSNVIPHQHSADRRSANQAVAEQIDFYKQQKEAISEEAKRVSDERSEEKRRVAEKQIKSLRRGFRSPGFMDEASTGLTDTLG